MLAGACLPSPNAVRENTLNWKFRALSPIRALSPRTQGALTVIVCPKFTIKVLISLSPAGACLSSPKCRLVLVCPRRNAVREITLDWKFGNRKRHVTRAALPNERENTNITTSQLESG